MRDARERTLRLVEDVGDEDVERVHSPLLSPLVWDLGHVAAFEDLWLNHRVGGHEPIHPELMEVYDANETPRARRGDLPYLQRAAAVEYLEQVRERALGGLDGADIAADAPSLTAEGFAWEQVIAHEHQHNETMLQTLAIAEAGVYMPRDRRALPAAGTAGGMVAIDAGPVLLGAAEGFAYDNERPQHVVDLDAFEIDRVPVSNGAYLDFVDAGGYERRDWWSQAGWRWRRRERIERPRYWTEDGLERRFDELSPIDPSLPVMHVSWYEADAYARACGKRLPTEAEWERAASGAAGGDLRRLPWGGVEPSERRANIDQRGFAPAPCGAYPAGASFDGVLGLVGDAWEWTASDFAAYPGFQPFPYEEYSAIFFGHDYKVLRGGSWATRSNLVRNSLRNWDFPERRQIFAGFRCARDA